MKKRYLVDNILSDVNEKMVFIGGARQVGKTSMARHIAENQQIISIGTPGKTDRIFYRPDSRATLKLFCSMKFISIKTGKIISRVSLISIAMILKYW